MSTPMASRRVAKKVRPPPKHTQGKEALDDVFARLARAIQEIQRKNASKLSFEEHYRYAYTLVLHRKPDMLYKGVTDLVISHLQNESRDRIEPAFPTSSLLSATGYSATATASSSKASAPTSVAASGAESVSRSSSSRNQTTATSAVGQDRLAQAMEGETFLSAVKSTWEDHKVCMRKLRDVLKYMDKVHTEPNGLAPTYTLGLHLFLVHLLRNPDVAIEQNVLNVSLALIRIERDGEIVNRGLLKTLTDMLCELREVSSDGKQGEGESVYKSWWEEHFLSETRRYYTTEADTNLETLSTPEFLLRVEKRLSEESDRIETYLHPNTCPLLFSLLDNVLIANTAQTVISNPTTGLASLLQDDKIDDLSRMYKLFGRTGDGHILLQRGLKAWMVEQGAKIIDNNASSSAASTTAPSAAGQGDAADTAAADVKGKGKARDDGAAPATTGFATSKAGPSAGSAAAASNLAIEWVTSVLSLKDKMDKIWNEAFEKDRHFQNAINDAFVTFVNQVKKAPEYISIFLDENLKKGLKGKNESEVDAVLDKTITLFRYLTDKDVFEDYYKRHLAKRLYSGRSVSDDAERGMLQKLKLECGAQFVSKLEGMLKDVGFSEELNAGYKRYLEGLNSDKPSAELSVQVCTSSFWPSAPDIPCILPPEFVRITKSFERYFDTRYTGRKLSWHAEHGSVDVKVRFDKGVKEINVATHGMVVLSQFANLATGETLSYPDLLAATGLPESNLKRTLQSLACAKYKVLKKDPASRNIGKEDKFSFNSSFRSELAKIKIQTIANRVETSEESRETDGRVDKERSQVIEAALVRIMKNRKQLPHNELVNEVTTQLSRRFSPKVPMIKMAMEKLIDKEYLARDEKDRRLIHYLA